MKYSIGNNKLGENCLVVSRAVGQTCPSSCYFLGNGCYAEATEKLFKNARKAGLSNYDVSYEDIVSLLELALEKNCSIRIHERGDFGREDALDIEYVKAWNKALIYVLGQGKLPDIWAYTHIYSRRLTRLLSPYMRLYASVHNKSDMRKAKLAGFNLFAYIDTDHRFMAKKSRGVNVDGPSFIHFADEKFLVCPEQRMGRDKVTCTGGKTKACNWCLKSSGKNVCFIEH